MCVTHLASPLEYSKLGSVTRHPDNIRRGTSNQAVDRALEPAWIARLHSRESVADQATDLSRPRKWNQKCIIKTPKKRGIELAVNVRRRYQQTWPTELVEQLQQRIHYARDFAYVLTSGSRFCDVIALIEKQDRRRALSVFKDLAQVRSRFPEEGGNERVEADLH
jgi:hypothetical protein